MSETIQVNSISQIHKALGLEDPKHPLVSVIQAEDMKNGVDMKEARLVINLCQITLKQGQCGTIRYGRNSYDYQNGTLVFIAPG